MRPELIEELKKETAGEDLDLSWLEKPAAQHGLRVAPGKRGLTLEDIATESYGDIPTSTGNQTGRMRGAAPRPDAQSTQQMWGSKSATWSESAMLLYEEAVQRQWSSATDIPWEQMPELDDDIEMAMSQLCTFLTQVEFIAGDVPGQYAPNVSAEYFEVGLFLASQIMDEARHLDVFRKRALANGIGLLSAGPGAIGLLTAQDFTEMASTLHLVGEGFVQSMFRMGELFAQSEVDKRGIQLYMGDTPIRVSQLNPGDKVSATIITAGKPEILTVKAVDATLAAEPAPAAAAPEPEAAAAEMPAAEPAAEPAPEPQAAASEATPDTAKAESTSPYEDLPKPYFKNPFFMLLVFIIIIALIWVLMRRRVKK